MINHYRRFKDTREWTDRQIKVAFLIYFFLHLVLCCGCSKEPSQWDGGFWAHKTRGLTGKKTITIWGYNNGVARTLKKIRTSKGDYCINQWFVTITSLFEMGTSLKGKNSLPEEANSFLLKQLLKVWKITFTTYGELPRVLLFLLRTCVYCVIGATPM